MTSVTTQQIQTGLLPLFRECHDISSGLHSGADRLIFLEIPLECRALAVFIGRDSLSHPLRETD
jgi:hypothetical protein